MALKVTDKARFDTLESSIKGMVSAGVDLETVKAGFAEQIRFFEQETGVLIKLRGEGEDFEVGIIDSSKDFVRVRSSNPENKVLRTKILGVGIEVKTFKKCEFEHSNKEIHDSLIALAEIVLSSPVDFAKCDNLNVEHPFKITAEQTEEIEPAEETEMAEEAEETEETEEAEETEQ